MFVEGLTWRPLSGASQPTEVLRNLTESKKMLEEARRELKESQERAQSEFLILLNRHSGQVCGAMCHTHPPGYTPQFPHHIPSHLSLGSLTVRPRSGYSSDLSALCQASPSCLARRASAKLRFSVKSCPTTSTMSSTSISESRDSPTSHRYTFRSQRSSNPILPPSRTCSDANGDGANSKRNRLRSSTIDWMS